MLQLIKRCPEHAEGYKSYCQESYDHNTQAERLLKLNTHDIILLIVKRSAN